MICWLTVHIWSARMFLVALKYATAAQESKLAIATPLGGVKLLDPR